MKSQMMPISHAGARANYGPANFWRELGEFLRDRRENMGREWLEYDEWRVFFRRAYDAGLLDVKAAAWERGKLEFGSVLGRAVMRTYRAVMDARKRGLTAEQFHYEFCGQIDHDSDVGKRALEYGDSKRREALEKATQERRNGDRRRRRDPDDQEINEVRVGYQPAQQTELVTTGKD